MYNDDLGPARGIILGLIMSCIFWAVFLFCGMKVYKFFNEGSIQTEQTE